jgi:hypothetical protein
MCLPSTPWPSDSRAKIRRQVDRAILPPRGILNSPVCEDEWIDPKNPILYAVYAFLYVS